MIDHDPDHPDSTERWIDDAMESLRNQIVARDAEIVRLRAGFLKSIQAARACDAGPPWSACLPDDACICALEIELWCNRAVPEGGA